MPVRILIIFGNRAALDGRLRETLVGARSQVKQTTATVEVKSPCGETVMDLMVLSKFEGPEKLYGRQWDVIMTDDSAWLTPEQREVVRTRVHRGTPGA